MILRKSMKLKKVLSNYYPEKAMEEEEILTPNDLTEEQKKVYLQIYSSSNNRDSGFRESIADIIARNPDLNRQYLEKHRHFTINTIGCILANNPNLQSIPQEILLKIFSLPHEEINNLGHIAQCLNNTKYELSEKDIPEIIDIAHTAEIIGQENKLEEDNTVGVMTEQWPSALKASY